MGVSVVVMFPRLDRSRPSDNFFSLRETRAMPDPSSPRDRNASHYYRSAARFCQRCTTGCGNLTLPFKRECVHADHKQNQLKYTLPCTLVSPSLLTVYFDTTRALKQSLQKHKFKASFPFMTERLFYNSAHASNTEDASR